MGCEVEESLYSSRMKDRLSYAYGVQVRSLKVEPVGNREVNARKPVAPDKLFLLLPSQGQEALSHSNA